MVCNIRHLCISDVPYSGSHPSKCLYCDRSAAVVKRPFVWPAPKRLIRQIKRRGSYGQARDAVWDFVVALKLPFYSWLGLRGFAGAVAWLLVSVTLLILAPRVPVPLPDIGRIHYPENIVACAHLVAHLFWAKQLISEANAL